MINFPLEPSIGQEYSISGSVERSWRWNGEAWILKTLPLPDNLKVKTIIESHYTLARSDSNQTMINMQSSTNRRVYVPTDDVDIPVGSVIIIGSTGDGYIGLVPATGVTITSPESLVISKKYGKITLIKTGLNTWEVEGNLRTSPTYIVTPSHLTRVEGNTFKFYVRSDDVFSDRLYYTITPISSTLTNEDFLFPENVLENGGFVPLTNGNGIFRITINEDIDIEGVEDFNVQLRLFSKVGPIVASTNNLSITDAL